MRNLERFLATALLLCQPAAAAGGEMDVNEPPVGEEHVLSAPSGRARAGSEMELETRTGRQAFRVYATGPEDAESGILMIHEWWGLNDHIRDTADAYASQGYRVFAIDLYDGEVATDSEHAARLMRGVDQRLANQKLAAALRTLRGERSGRRTATLGWCFGGGQSLQAALSSPELVDAAVVYYGRMVTEARRLEALDMPVLGIFALQDGWITPEHVGAFGQAMVDAGASVELHIYDEGHAFANPSSDRYAERAATAAAAITGDFLDRNLGSGAGG